MARLKIYNNAVTAISGSSPDMDRRFRLKPWTGSM